VSLARAKFGAVQNRLEHKIANLNVTLENITASESRIRDADIASEMMSFTKNEILIQASQTMIKQAAKIQQGAAEFLK
jgi:flagellin